MPDALENWQAGLCLSFLYMTRIRDFKTGCRPSTLPLRVATDVLRTEMYSKSSHLQSLTPRSIKASTSYLNAYMATQLSAECSAWAVRAWPLGSFGKTSVLTVVTHIVLPRSTETQLAAWTSGVLGISANSVTSCYRLIHECVQPLLRLSALFPTCGQQPCRGENCRHWTMVLVISKTGGKASVPCPPPLPQAYRGQGTAERLRCRWFEDPEMQVIVRQEHFGVDGQ